MDSSVRDGKIYEFELFVLDPIRRDLTHEGSPVALSPTLFEALLYFVEHPGRVVSREELLDAIWPAKVVEDANVSQTIFTLRRALTRTGAARQIIATAPRRGYRFTAAVHVRTPWTAQPVHPGPVGAAVSVHADDAARLQSNGRHGAAATARLGRRRWPYVGGACCALALVAAGVLIALKPWRPRSAPVSRLMVLSDFENRTHDPVFDKTLNMAARIDLRQSPSVQVLSEAKAQDLLDMMTKPRDTPLTPAIAREVCTRANGQDLITGTLTQIGARYLLTLSATDCADGQERFAEKAEVGSRDDVLPALDRMADHMRHRIDGDRVPIEAFGYPLLPRRTVSLDALKAYSEAQFLVGQGKRLEAVPQFQHAVALDPQFAMAYRDLAVVYDNLNDETLAQATAQKAHGLRDSVSDYDRSLIDYTYNQIVTHDVEAAITSLQARVDIHPNDPAAWASLSDRENWVGRYDLAITAGRRALALQTDAERPYAVLARALLHAGQFDQAASVCAEGVARHVDGDDLHGLRFQIAAARRDEAGMAEEMQWARANSAEATLLIDAFRMSFSRGQVHQALEQAARALALRKDKGMSNLFAAPNARILFDLGLTQLAKDSLSRRPPGEPSADGLFSIAEMGDAHQAEAMIRSQVRTRPSDTLLNISAAPQARAALALRNGTPLEAIEDLRVAAPYERIDEDVPYLRGRAYLAALDGPRAAQEFHKILDHPGPDILSHEYPLARLGLARALTLEHNIPAARAAYLRFLSDWKEADQDVPVLVEAKAEWAALPR